MSILDHFLQMRSHEGERGQEGGMEGHWKEGWFSFYLLWLSLYSTDPARSVVMRCRRASSPSCSSPPLNSLARELCKWGK